MAVKRFSNSLISQSGQDKVNNFIAGYSPAIDEMDLISRVTLSASASSIEFTSIPQIYQHLQLRITGRTERNQVVEAIRLEINSNTTASNYAEHWLYGTGTSALAYGAANTLIGIGRVAGALSSTNVVGSIIVNILDYTSTSKNKTISYIGGCDNNGAGEVVLGSGLFINTSAVTSLKIYGVVGSSWVVNSLASLYGVKA